MRAAWTSVTAGAVATAVVIARLLVRGPDALDRVWAEDGRVFLVDRVTRGADAFLASYAGYGHLLPRVLAAAGGLLPLAAFAVWCAMSAAVVAGVCAGWCHAVCLRLTGSQPLAAGAAGAVVLPAALGIESLGNLANLQWFLLVTLAWTCLDPGRSRAARVGGFVVGVLAAGCSPLVVLLAPTVLLAPAWWRGRGPVFAGVAVGLAYQAAVTLSGIRTGGGPPREPDLRLGMVGSVVRQLGGQAPGATVVGALTLAVLVGAVVSGWSRPGVVALVAAAALVLVVPVLLNGTVQGRYVGVAVSLAWSAAVLAAADRRPRWRWAVPAALVVLALVAFPVAPYRVSGPTWAPQVERAACSGTVTFGLAPAGSPAVTLPCTTLSS